MVYAERSESPTKGALEGTQIEVSKIREMANDRAAVLIEQAGALDRQARELRQAAEEWTALAEGIPKSERVVVTSPSERSY